MSGQFFVGGLAAISKYSNQLKKIMRTKFLYNGINSEISMCPSKTHISKTTHFSYIKIYYILNVFDIYYMYI